MSLDLMADVDPALLEKLTPEDLAFLEHLDEHRRFNRPEFYEPYPKQWEFIAMGSEKNERCMFAGNQFGKTDIGAYEASYHLTGLYPDGWPGRKWDRPTRGWAAGETTTVVRDAQQTKLFGPAGVDEEFGTGFIPKHCIIGKPTLGRGSVSDSYDMAKIRHFTNGVEDGISILQFKSYEQGRKKFASSTIDWIWWDEEPDEDIYTEGNARWTATNGMSFMTFTPLQGMSKVVKRFRRENDPLRGYVQMAVADAKHLTEAHVKAMLAKYPKYQWRARIQGLPMLGAGQVFMADEEMLKFNYYTAEIPLHWRKLWGIDFGIGHPFAAVLCAWDPETDTFYVLKTYRVSGAIPITHVDAINRIGGGIPVAWPHDGAAREKGSGEQLAQVYRKLFGPGIMMASHATFPEGGYSTEAAIMEIDQRMQDGRFRAAADLVDFWEEYRMYHRDEDGFLVKEDDDILSAMMKAVMMKRYARPGPIGSLSRRTAPPTKVLRTVGAIDLFTGEPLPS